MSSFSVVSAAGRLRERDRFRRTLRFAGPAGYAVVLAVFVYREGMPLSRDRLLMWILLGLLAASLTNMRGWIRGVVLEWLPFAFVLWAYDLLRGQADGLLFSAHVRPQLRADEILFGGTVPTVWLQERLWHGSSSLRWYDYGACLVYVSYFLATYLVAAFLWFFAPAFFRRFVAMVSLLALMAFATYAVFPAAPPWLASEDGQLEPTTRSIGSILGHIPIGNFDALFERGSQYANPVAAVPSLHAAYTLLITLFLWRLVPRWTRVPLAAYPLLMAFALVYTAEHYLVDVLLGWVYTLIAFWTVNHLAGWLAAEHRFARRSELGRDGRNAAVPSGHVARPDAASSVASIALLSALPASLPRNDHRTPTTSDVPPIPPTRSEKLRVNRPLFRRALRLRVAAREARATRCVPPRAERRAPGARPTGRT